MSLDGSSRVIARTHPSVKLLPGNRRKVWMFDATGPLGRVARPACAAPLRKSHASQGKCVHSAREHWCLHKSQINQLTLLRGSPKSAGGLWGKEITGKLGQPARTLSTNVPPGRDHVRPPRKGGQRCRVPHSARGGVANPCHFLRRLFNPPQMAGIAVFQEPTQGGGEHLRSCFLAIFACLQGDDTSIGELWKLATLGD